jgi:hypothetical protein
MQVAMKEAANKEREREHSYCTQIITASEVKLVATLIFKHEDC